MNRGFGLRDVILRAHQVEAGYEVNEGLQQQLPIVLAD